MPILLNETWTNGPGIFSTLAYYDRSSNGTDTAYLYFNEAEGVKVSSGVLTLSTGLWANAGVWGGTTKYTNFHLNTTDYSTGSAWLDTPVYEKTSSNNRGYYYDASAGYFEVSYTPTAASLDAALYAPVLAVHSTPSNAGWPIQVNYEHGAPGTVWIEYWQRGLANGYESANYTLTAGQTYVFRAAWKCGTIGSTWTTTAADGYLRLYINDVQVWEATSIKLTTETILDNPLVNKMGGFFVGFHGLLGDVGYFTLANDEFTVSADPPGESRPGYPLWQSGPTFGGGAGA
jgi:hypothetical protein